MHNGTAAPNPGQASKPTTLVSLPPVNKPRQSKASVPQINSVSTTTTIESDQLALLQKYSSRLSKINEFYADQLGMGVGVNRKGPSATANRKDKSDRATTEQVLDPRTRLILYKMIGRGVLYEVNGCISTGKEVGFSSHPVCRRMLSYSTF